MKPFQYPYVLYQRSGEIGQSPALDAQLPPKRQRRSVGGDASGGASSSKSSLARAECIFTCDLLWPVGGSNNQKTHLVVLGNTSPGGLIPNWVVNMVADKAPVKWIPKLEQACVDFMAARGISPGGAGRGRQSDPADAKNANILQGLLKELHE